jgi:hypothetical protein
LWPPPVRRQDVREGNPRHFRCGVGITFKLWRPEEQGPCQDDGGRAATIWLKIAGPSSRSWSLMARSPARMGIAVPLGGETVEVRSPTKRLRASLVDSRLSSPAGRTPVTRPPFTIQYNYSYILRLT